MFCSLCKFLNKELSIYPTDRIRLNSPDKGIIIHMCCVFSGYHGVAAHVKQNHDTFTFEQKEQITIRSAQKTWSVSAEAYDADSREFGITTTKFSLSAIVNWHLSCKGPRCIECNLLLNHLVC